MAASVAYTLYNHGGTVIDGEQYNCRLTVKKNSQDPPGNGEAYFIFTMTYLNHIRLRKQRKVTRQDFFSDTGKVVSDMLAEVPWNLPGTLTTAAIPWLRACACAAVLRSALREARVISLEMEIAGPGGDRATAVDVDEDDDDVGETCAICLEKLLSRETVVRTPCMHLFHKDCVMRWINAPGKSCPACRKTVRILREV